MAEASAVRSHLPLNDRVAIVTGGSQGIGRAITLHLASLGAKIVINYSSNSSEANALASQLNTPSAAPRAVAVQADLSDLAQVKRLFDAAESAFNTQPHIFSVNARGASLVCKEAAERLKRGGGGRIICLSTSLVGALRPGYAAYTASKAAVETMVKILAKELKGTGITAYCVAPGPLATEMFFSGKTEEAVRRLVEENPMSRLGEPKDVGFFSSDSGEWVNGQVIRVNGGYV
ncbi:hypothetical protein NMG60_11003870 [Bertholletia excelsa]